MSSVQDVYGACEVTAVMVTCTRPAKEQANEIPPGSAKCTTNQQQTQRGNERQTGLDWGLLRRAGVESLEWVCQDTFHMYEIIKEYVLHTLFYKVNRTCWVVVVHTFIPAL